MFSLSRVTSSLPDITYLLVEYTFKGKVPVFWNLINSNYEPSEVFSATSGLHAQFILSQCAQGKGGSIAISSNNGKDFFKNLQPEKTGVVLEVSCNIREAEDFLKNVKIDEIVSRVSRIFTSPEKSFLPELNLVIGQATRVKGRSDSLVTISREFSSPLVEELVKNTEHLIIYQAQNWTLLKQGESRQPAMLIFNQGKNAIIVQGGGKGSFRALILEKSRYKIKTLNLAVGRYASLSFEDFFPCNLSSFYSESVTMVRYGLNHSSVAESGFAGSLRKLFYRTLLSPMSRKISFIEQIQALDSSLLVEEIQPRLEIPLEMKNTLVDKSINDYFTSRQQDKKLIVGVSLDMDSCIFNSKYSATEATFDDLLNFNTNIFDQLLYIKQSVMRKDDVLVGYLGGANRQSFKADFDSTVRARHLPSSFPTMISICKEIGASFDDILIADIMGDLKSGTSFQMATAANAAELNHAECSYDESRVSTLYAQMHKLATENPDTQILFRYICRPSFADKLKNYFADGVMIPSNVTLAIDAYRGDASELKPLIQGQGIIDKDYRRTIKKMMELGQKLKDDAKNPDFIMGGNSQIISVDEVSREAFLPKSRALLGTEEFAYKQEGKKQVVAVSLDADGCIFNPAFRESDQTMEKLFEHNQLLLDKIQHLKVDKVECVGYIGSNRQSLMTDCMNQRVNRKLSCFVAIPRIYQKLSIKFDNVLIADIEAHKEPGCSFDAAIDLITDNGQDLDGKNSWFLAMEKLPAIQAHANWSFDNTKVSILYAQMHKLATENPDAEILFNFFDDKEEILDALTAYFSDGVMMPSNVKLALYSYDGDKLELKSPLIQGQGIVDMSYQDTIRKMMKLAVEQAENIKKGVYVHEVLRDQFVKERKSFVKPVSASSNPLSMFHHKKEAEVVSSDPNCVLS
jgi:hypothetical protein